MAPWKKLLSISANLGKYEKEEKQKYKQYVKIEKQNAQLRSKSESEVYEDFCLLRSKSLRRSSKKRKAPGPRTIENAYEIIEGQSPSNVVVINDDLRNRFAGYELPKIQENIYVVVQPHEAEIEKPTRLRWKKAVPTPLQTPTAPDNKLQEKTIRKPKTLRVPEDDPQDTSMSEEFYDCEEYLEILSPSPTEDLKKSRRSYNLDAAAKTTSVDGHPNLPKRNLIKTTNPNYDSTSEGSLTRLSNDVEYAEAYEDYYENQTVYNRYSGEDFGPEDESRWQPSNIRFCEMSGDEEEQQIYGPFGTYEVANYEDTLNSRIQMVLETERYSVMLSLEDQRNAEAADNIDGAEVEKVFEFTGSGTYLDPNADSFGAVGAFETEREDEMVEAKNIALIESLENPKRDKNIGHDLGGFTPFNLHEEVIQRGNEEDIQRAKNVGGSTSSNLNEEIHEEPREAKNVARHLKVPTPFNLHQEVFEEVQKAKDVGGSTPSHLHEEVHEEPKGAKNLAHHLKVPIPFNLHQEVYEEVQRAEDVDHHLSVPIPFNLPDDNEAVIRKEGKDDTVEQKESPTLPLEKDFQEDVKEIPQVEAETKENPHQPSFRLIDNYSAFLKDPMSMMTPRLSLRSSSKLEQDDPKPNETAQHKENSVAYENLQFNPSTREEESPPHLKKLRNPAFRVMTPRSILRSSSKIEDVPKPSETIQRKESGDAYENLQFNRSTHKEESPPHLKKTLHPRSQLNLHSSSKIEQDDPKPAQHEENDDTYENFQFSRLPRKEESPPHLEKSPQATPGYHKNPVAQPRLNLSYLKRSRPLGQTENNFEPLKNKEERENSKLLGKAQPQNAISDLFNGLPVESERSNHETYKEAQNKRNSWEIEAKSTDLELFNGLPVTRQEIESKLNADVNNEDDSKIQWETKPKMSSNDTNTVTYFSTSKEDEVQSEILEFPRNTKPTENNPEFFNNTKGERIQNEFSKTSWETNPKISPMNEDTSIFFYNVKEEEVPIEILEIPWGTRPKMSSINTFVPFSEAPEKEFVNPKKSEQVQENCSSDATPKLNNLPKASEDVQNKAEDHEHIKFDRDSETPEYVNFKIPWKTRPKNLEQNKKSSVRDTSSNFDDDVIDVSNEPDFQFKEKIITPERPGQNSPSSQNVRNKDIKSNTFDPLEKSGVLGKPTDTDVHPKELGNDVSTLRGPARSWRSNPSDEAGRLKQDNPSLDTEDSKSENFVVDLERSHSLKQKTWHVNILEKYESPNLNHHENEAGTKNLDINDEDAIVINRHQIMKLATESEKNQPNFTIGQTIVDDKVEKGETQNEANILEENYRIIRGFDVAKEEGITYHNIQNVPDSPQRPFKRPKIPKKVSFRINKSPDVSEEGPSIYVPAHSPTEKIGRINKSAKLEAITRKLEKTPGLQHSISLTETEKPKPNFSTFPRNTSRVQSLHKHSDLERLHQVLSGINDLTSVHEQVSAMEDVSNKVKERVDKFDRFGPENEYSELLQILFRSVRITTVLECGFDPDLLDRQQTVLSEIKNSMSTLNSK